MLLGWAVLTWPSAAATATPPAPAGPPNLALTELKITGSEFLVLRNNSGKDIANLSSYWLQYFNDPNPLGPGVNSSTQQLPSLKLGSGQTILLSSDGMATCGAAAAGKLSVSLGDSGGFLQIMQTAMSPLGVSLLPVDYVSWSSGTNGQIQSVPSASKDPAGLYYRFAGNGGYVWQLADLETGDACRLDVKLADGSNSTVSAQNGLVQSVSTIPTVVGSADTTNENADLPAADVGLAAPQISEVLPNPAPPKTDADDEFVELYNSNDKPFDLSGFSLQAGVSTTHKYTFPNDTVLLPRQFMAYFANQTDLSLSNNSGQVKLLDPAGNTLEQTDIYGTAKDNYAWVKSGGLWQWTTTPTPGLANVITLPVTKSLAKVKGASTKSKSAASGVGSTGSPGSSGPASAAPVHPWILAAIGSAALLYGGYEYRHDLANALYRFRRHRTARRIVG